MMKIRPLVFLILFLVLIVHELYAHEVRPAYLELRQTSAETYDVLWKVPGAGENRRLALYVEFAPDCSSMTVPQTSFADNAFTERWSVKRKGGLTGSKIHIEGLTYTMTDVLVRVERLDGSTQVVRLMPSSPSFVVSSAPDRLEVAKTYARLGVEHILSGVDHLLFIMGLLLLVRGGSRLVKTITAFTLAHSITLSLASLGFVYVPPKPVEVVIALSIVFVAREILVRREGAPSFAERQPWVVAFTFGLLHGLGFAGGLTAAGLPAGHIPLALLFFSCGVEIGHFSFVGAVLGTIAILKRLDLKSPTWAQPVPPYAIGTMAMFWVIQRLSLF